MHTALDCSFSRQVRLDGEVVAGPDLSEQRIQVVVSRVGDPPRPEQPLRVVLGLLDVRLVEGVDTKHCAGHRHGELPPEELAPEVDGLVQCEVGDGVAGFFERTEGLPHLLLPHRDEQPVGPVDLRWAHVLALDRHDPPSFLPRRFGDELLDPIAERADALVEYEGQLVAAHPGRFAQERTQPRAGVVLRWDLGRAGVGRLGRPVEEALEVGADQRCRDEAEVRQR